MFHQFKIKNFLILYYLTQETEISLITSSVISVEDKHNSLIF